LIFSILNEQLSSLEVIYKKEPSDIIKELENTEFNQITINRIKKHNWVSIIGKSENENRIEIIHIGNKKFLIYSFTHSVSRWTNYQIFESDAIGMMTTDKSVGALTWDEIRNHYHEIHDFINSNKKNNISFDNIKNISIFSNLLNSSSRYNHFGLDKDFKNIRMLIFINHVNLNPLTNKKKVASMIMKKIINEGRYSFFNNFPSKIKLDDFIENNLELDVKCLLPYLMSRYSFTHEEFLDFKKNEFKDEFLLM